MRRLASFLLLGVALTAGATEVWRWKDANGVIHYSDSPVPGAERVSANPAPKPGGSTATTQSRAVREADSNPPQSPQRYTSCQVTRPANDTTFHGEEVITAAVEIEPLLMSGHRLQVTLNGSVYPQWTGTNTTYTFPRMDRGSYALAVQVLDAKGDAVCTGSAINFYVQQPSLLSPGRQQPAPTKPNPPPPPPPKPPITGPVGPGK